MSTKTFALRTPARSRKIFSASFLIAAGMCGSLVASASCTFTSPLSTLTDFNRPNETMSRLNPGYFTAFSAWRICSSESGILRMIGTDRRAVRSSRVGGAAGGRPLPTTILPWLSSKDAPAFFLEKQQLAGHDQLMKTSLRILLAAAALAALGACATYPKGGQPALVGTWTNPLGTVWVLNADGTFTVDLNHDGKTDVTGKYSVSGDMITIEE